MSTNVEREYLDSCVNHVIVIKLAGSAEPLRGVLLSHDGRSLVIAREPGGDRVLVYKRAINHLRPQGKSHD